MVLWNKTQKAGRKGRKRDSDNIIRRIFNGSLQTVTHPSSNHLQCTSHAFIQHEQSYLQGFTSELQQAKLI